MATKRGGGGGGSELLFSPSMPPDLSPLLHALLRSPNSICPGRRSSVSPSGRLDAKASTRRRRDNLGALATDQGLMQKYTGVRFRNTVPTKIYPNKNERSMFRSLTFRFLVTRVNKSIWAKTPDRDRPDSSYD